MFGFTITSHNAGRSLALCGVGTLAAMLANVAPANGAQASASTTMNLSAKLVSFHQQSAPKHGARAGETFQFTDRLSRGSTQVGHDAGSGTYVDPGHFELDWTIVIEGGSLQMAGVGRPTNDAYHLAIVGGTGKYAGASGTMTVTDANKAVAHYHLLLGG